MTDPPWILRSYVPEVDDLSYLLDVGYTRSKAGVRAGAHGAGRKSDGNAVDHAAVDKQKAFMSAHHPIFVWLLEHADTRVACDPERPEIIYAWAITSEPNVIHVVGAKYDVTRDGFGREMIEQLLGDRLTSPQVVTLELPQMPGERPGGGFSSGAIMQRPQRWYTDPTWLLTRMIGGRR